MLRLELEELADVNFDTSLTGFSLAEIGELKAESAGGQGSGAGSLAAQFGVPPFSVLNAREGWWQERKKAWLSLGIQSELGRGENALDMSAETVEPGLLSHYRKARKANAIPGGNASA